MIKIKRRNIFLYLAVIGLLVFLYISGALHPIERLVTSVLNPIFSGFHSASSDLRIKYNEQESKDKLVARIKELEGQVNMFIQDDVKVDLLREENQILREHLEFLTEKKYKYVMSNVISRGDITDVSGRTEVIIIDKGSDNGLYPGLGVVNSDGIIVGKISEVKGSISKVDLTNSSCKLAVAILNQDGTSGITEGELGLTIKMSFIPQSKEININDTVITSGLEQMIPRGLVVGRVIDVIKESNELWQEAIIEPLVNPEDLIIVSVLMPHQEELIEE